MRIKSVTQPYSEKEIRVLPPGQPTAIEPVEPTDEKQAKLD